MCIRLKYKMYTTLWIDPNKEGLLVRQIPFKVKVIESKRQIFNKLSKLK